MILSILRPIIHSRSGGLCALGCCGRIPYGGAIPGGGGLIEPLAGAGMRGGGYIIPTGGRPIPGGGGPPCIGGGIAGGPRIGGGIPGPPMPTPRPGPAKPGGG